MFTYKSTLATQTVALYLQFLAPVASIAATITSTAAGGDWSAQSTWVNNIVPVNGDDITIASGAQVKIDADVNLQSLLISGTLTFETNATRAATISGNVTINNGGTFQTGSSGTISTHTLSVGGNLTNNGILDFSTNNNTTGANITFTGASNTIFGGSGSTTDILTLTINKGTNKTPILQLNPSVLTVQGISANTEPFLTLTKGTIHIQGTYTFSSTPTMRAANAYTVCSSSTGFWLDNPNFTVLATSASVDADGLFKMTQGTFNVGSGSTNSFNLATTTDLVMESGTLNVASRLKGSPSNFTMSGGVMNICTEGNSTTTASFSVNAKYFTMSGGNIIIQKPNTGTAAKSYSGYGSVTATITGGTLTCAPNSTGTFAIEGDVPALVIDGLGDKVKLMNDVDIYGGITINNGGALDLNNFILYLSKGNILNNGAITAPFTASSYSSELSFVANTTQSYTGTGTFGTTLEPIAILSVNNGNAFNIGASSNNLNINNLYLFSGNISNANKLEIGNPIGLYSRVQYGSTITAILSGNMDMSPTFNIGSGGLAIFYAKELNVRTCGFEIPPTRLIKQLTLIGNTISLLGGDLNVSHFLDFQSGKINLGSNNLVLESTVAITGANSNGYAVTNGTGRVTRKNISNTATLFPVGTTTYDPVSITNTGTVDDFSVGVTANLDAFAPMPTKYIQRQWNISEVIAGGSNVTLSLTCAVGAPTNNFDAAVPVKIGHYKSNNSWEQIPATMSSMVATGSNITSFSPFVIVNENAILPVELIDFQGIAQDKQNIIRWQTASEKDIKHFVLERRNNYEGFKSLDFVAAIGHVNLPQSYQWIDDAPTPLSMYRLKMVDLDGSFEYSKTITIEHTGGNAITILPNREADDWGLRLQNMPIGVGSIALFDMQGKLQYVQKIDNQFIVNDIKFSTTDLPNGAYVLVCRILGQTVHQQFIKF